MDLAAFYPSWLSHIPFGWIVFVLLVLLFIIDAMRSGPAHASMLAISAPVSLFLFSLVSHTFLLGGVITPFLSSTYIMAGIFVVLFIATFLLANRMTATFSGSSGGLMNSLLAGVGGTVVLFVLWIQVPALLSLWNPGTQIHSIFGTPFALAWFLVVYVVLAFVRS